MRGEPRTPSGLCPEPQPEGPGRANAQAFGSKPLQMLGRRKRSVHRTRPPNPPGGGLTMKGERMAGRRLYRTRARG